MFDEKLRPIKEKLLYAIAKKIGKYLSPNKITFLSLILGIMSFCFVYKGSFKIGLICWFLNRIFDGLDGTIARVTNRQSDLGGYFDILVDFFIYVIIPIGFILNRGLITKETITLIIMISVFYINSASWMYLSSIIEKRKSNKTKSLTSVNMPKGLIEGFETIIVYTLFFIFPDNIFILFILMSILTSIGIIQRIIWATRNLD